MADTSLTTYKIQPGDNFYLLAKRFNLSLEAVQQVNSGVDADKLMIGQEIKLPASSSGVKPQSPAKRIPQPVISPGRNTYTDSPTEGETFAGRSMDHIGVNIGGVDFELKRVIENNIPHEVHIILPRTEVHTVTRSPECVLCETQVMISNIDIVHSPRQ